MASTSFSKSLGSVVGAKRLMVSPSFEIRNLVKFHLMSLSFSTLLLMALKLADGLEERLGSFGFQAVVLLCGSYALQILEDGLRIGAVDITLLHNLKCNTVVQLAELLNLCIALRILLLELVAGEADNHQSLVLVLLVQFLQSCELRCESTLAGSVDNQQHLTLKL